MLLQAVLCFMKDITNANKLVEAFNKSKRGVTWKESVQRYELNLLDNIRNTQRKLLNGTYNPKPMLEFELNERGHQRYIKAQHISDRVVQRSFNDNVLLPLIRPKLIYDNGASLKDKGLTFSRKRFEIHLRNAYKEYSGEGYILLMDFSKFFDNIRHDKLLAMFEKLIPSDILPFVKQTIDTFRIDVSHMTDGEAKAYIDQCHDSLKQRNIPTDNAVKKFCNKSVGIGNQLSQTAGIFYPHEIDNYCKIVRGIKYYGRYMDDTYIIMKDKEELQDVLSHIKDICRKLGIFINKKKTGIHRLTQWITWLKINYKVKPSGGLVKKVHNSTFRRERRRVLKFNKLLKTKRMRYADILNCYRGWRGTYRKFDSKRKLYELDIYFCKLFKEELRNVQGRITRRHNLKRRKSKRFMLHYA